MLKRLELIRGFFRFCVDSEWMQSNPAKAIKAPVVKQKPTLPFSDEQMKRSHGRSNSTPKSIHSVQAAHNGS